jgi:hypothetical protein
MVQGGVHDEDIDRQIAIASRIFVRRQGFTRMRIQSEQFPGLRQVAQSMVMQHFDDGEPWSIREGFRRQWLSKLHTVVGWTFPVSDIGETVSSGFNEN